VGSVHLLFGLGHGSISSPGSGLGWAGSMKVDPRTTLLFLPRFQGHIRPE